REKIQLKSVVFSEFPTLGPQVVTVTISHGGVDRIRMSGRSVKGDRFVVHPEIPFIANLFVNVPDTKIWLTNPAPAGFLRREVKRARGSSLHNLRVGRLGSLAWTSRNSL